MKRKSEKSKWACSSIRDFRVVTTHKNRPPWPRSHPLSRPGWRSGRRSVKWLVWNFFGNLIRSEQEYFFYKKWFSYNETSCFDSKQNKFCLGIQPQKARNGILLPKLFWPTVRKKCSSDWEKLLKFEAEGREFAKFLRSLEQFMVTECFFNLFLEVTHLYYKGRCFSVCLWTLECPTPN